MQGIGTIIFPIWTHESSQLQTLFAPGFYLSGYVIPIPKLVAVSLTFSFFLGISYQICSRLEKIYRAYSYRLKKPVSHEQAQHVIFTLSTALSFCIFFYFGGRPNINLLSDSVVFAFDALIIIVSFLWLYRTLGRSSENYHQESIATSTKRLK